MFFSPRIAQRELAQLCHRLGTALDSGVDVRRVINREAEGRSSPAVRRRMADVSNAIGRGQALHEAFAEAGSFFPPIFHEMVRLGEETGHLGEVFRHLADHYDAQEKLRRGFLASITWPAIQLTAAIGIVGLIIWFMGFIDARDLRNQPIDVLGFGLRGTAGLIKYACFVAVTAGAIYALYQAGRRGAFWAAPLQVAVIKTPKLGRAIETLALSRLAWAMHLTFGAGMDILRALPLSLRSMRNAYYSRGIDEMMQSLRRGQEVHEVLAAARVFPPEFLDALEVGERSGRLPEAMARLSEQYQDESRRSMEMFAKIAGFAVWAIVAAIIVMVIVRLASFYLNMINQAL